jgi:hypothetical protein
MCNLASALTYSHPQSGAAKLQNLHIDGNVGLSSLSLAEHKTVGKVSTPT